MTSSSLPSSWAAAGVDPRRPAPVDLPRCRAPKGAELVRLRLPDRPGSLAAVTAHLAEHGVDVLGLEVVGHGPDGAVDDLLLRGEGLGPALQTLGLLARVLARRTGVDLRDPALAMAAACESVGSARTDQDAHRRLVGAALGLVFADAGLLCVSREHAMLSIVASTESDLPAAVDGHSPSLLTSALFSGEPLTAEGRIPWAPPALQCRLPLGSVAVVPAGPLVLALVRSDHAPYVSLELERLAALMRAAHATHEGR